MVTILALLTVGWVRRSSVRVRLSSVSSASSNKKSGIMPPNLYKKTVGWAQVGASSDKGVSFNLYSILVRVKL
jgi:hypothetical protein